MRKITTIIFVFSFFSLLHASNPSDETIANGPGMKDDTNALYNSYLKKNQPNEEYWINKESRNNYNNYNQNLKAEQYYYPNYGNGTYAPPQNNYNNYNQNLKAEQYYYPNYGNGTYAPPQNYGPTPYYSVPPYPQPGSQPGMGDDSNALYQSYLRAHHQGY